MSVLLYVQQELRESFDDVVGFQTQEYTHPCTACVASLHRHIFLRCCEAEVAGPCVLCSREEKECTAIPAELLGTAQTIWNYAKVMAEKHEKGDLNDVQRWRSHRARKRACDAWDALLDFLEQPVDFGCLSLDIVQMQEAATMREITIINLLHKIGIIESTEEVLARLSALAPPWSQHEEPARKLRDAVRNLKVAKDVPASGVAQERSISEFPQLIAAEVVGELNAAPWSMAPVRDVCYPGVRLQICEEILNENQDWWDTFDDDDDDDDDEKPMGPAHEHKHEHESQFVSGPEPPKGPAKPKHARPADMNPSKKAVTAGKTASKSSRPTEPIKSKAKNAHINDDGYDDDRREEEEEETGVKAGPDPVARPRKRPAPSDEDDTGSSSEGKPRKITRALKRIAAKS
ncbi:hypothetical protein CTA2_2751 [Colletotrichum tanaceti]|uniref:Uncharacterized protein n=1 Tax=Colletotrichum tanaceti TaxID=1306861 RepID=A0A4U6XKH3_9PEZI|nr:hypothetical protein CTA2_2751 [Colletotrichum tanaceti]TKW55237.1 hypothetical protein CTA1_3309 [Colletotrichum tanaceti]